MKVWQSKQKKTQVTAAFSLEAQHAGWAAVWMLCRLLWLRASGKQRDSKHKFHLSSWVGGKRAERRDAQSERNYGRELLYMSRDGDDEDPDRGRYLGGGGITYILYMSITTRCMVENIPTKINEFQWNQSYQWIRSQRQRKSTLIFGTKLNFCELWHVNLSYWLIAKVWTVLTFEPSSFIKPCSAGVHSSLHSLERDSYESPTVTHSGQK